MEIPLNAESLPLADAPADPASEGLRVEFMPAFRDRIQAHIKNGHDFIKDIIVGENFEECYDAVVRAYPQARWFNPNDDLVD